MRFLGDTTTARFKCIQMAYWSAVASLLGYATAYATDAGLTATQLTLMIAVSRIFAFGGQFFWGAIADRTQKNRMLFIVTMIMTYGVSLCFYYSTTYVMFFVFYCMTGFLQTPISSNLDTWIIKCNDGDSRRYTIIRAYGAFGFAIFHLFYGMAVDHFGYGIMPWTMLVMEVFVIYLAIRLPEVPSGGVGGAKRMSFRDIGALLKNTRYLFVLAVMFFTGFSMATVGSVKYLIYKSVGGSVAYQGFDSFVNGMFQVVGMFLATKFVSRLGPKKCLVAAIAMTLMEMVVTFLARTPFMVLSAALFAGGCYGLLLPSYRMLVQKSVDPSVTTTAQGLTDALYNSVAGFVGGLMSGPIIDNLGMSALILVCMCIAGVALALGVVMVCKVNFDKAAN